MLLAPSRWPRRVSPPPVLLVSEPIVPMEPGPRPTFDYGRLLLVFLLFKLMFLSGATKILSGDPT